eukprot:525643-Rhodomonas_salina.2
MQNSHCLNSWFAAFAPLNPLARKEGPSVVSLACRRGGAAQAVSFEAPHLGTMSDEKKFAFSRFKPTFLTSKKQQIVPKFSGGTQQTDLNLNSSYFNQESVDAGDSDGAGGEEQWVNIQHPPEISPPVQELDQGGLSRDWTIFLEAYRDEVVEKVSHLHAMAKTDRSKANRPILLQIQQQEDRKEEIVSAQDMTNGPHRLALLCACAHTMLHYALT